ncbi:TraG family conjugative transposon ATPase [Persicobacter diffluens]|uniref:TraG P-loop domain-containing protein n=1 Tax=Persicobacter diffluens TaxID=981 RepID=A0AAN4W4P1_9BACT|nr:hypothetical protein PEDI_51730 [Persicobacter diffluens]
MSKKKQAFELPIIGIDDFKGYSVFYQNTGDFSAMFEITNTVEQYCADPDAYEQFHAAMLKIIGNLKEGYILQKQDIFIRKKYQAPPQEDFLSACYHDHFKGRIYTEVKTLLTITLQVHRGGMYVFDPRAFQDFVTIIHKIESELKESNFNPTLYFSDSIRQTVLREVSFSFDKEVMSIENFHATESWVGIGDERRIKVISLIDTDNVDLPAQLSSCKIQNIGHRDFPVDLMSFLYSVPDYELIIYNQIIEVVDKLKTLAKLEAKKRKHKSMPDPANDYAIRDIEALQQEMERDNLTLVNSHFSILVKTHRDKLKDVANHIDSRLKDLGIHPSETAYNQFELFKANISGNAGSLKHYDRFLTTANAAICLMAKERLPQDDPSDFKLYFTDRQGVPIGIDTNEYPRSIGRTNNRNKFVLGPSGGGKSFCWNSVIRQYYLYKSDIMIIDVGHSYSGLCDYYNGRYITYSDDNPITVNPFLVTPEDLREVEKLHSLVSLIAILWKGTGGILTKLEESILSEVLRDYFTAYFEEKTIDQLSFNTFYEFSGERIKQIKKAHHIDFDLYEYQYILKSFYKGGQYDFLLNNTMDSSLFDEQFIVFEIDNVKDHPVLFPILTLIIMDISLQKMKRKKGHKALIIEEAWKAIASPMMVGYIQYLYKTCRKMYGEACLVTQELDDIISSETLRKTVIGNSSVVMLLDQTELRRDYESIAKVLNLDEVEQHKIFSIHALDNQAGRSKFKEVYIKRGKTGETYGVEVSDEEYFIYSTEKPEKEALKLYMKTYGGVEPAVKALVKDYRASGLIPQAFAKQVTSKQ